MRFVEARKTGRLKRRQSGKTPSSEQNSQSASEHGERGALDEQLANQAQASGSQGRPDRELFATRR